MRRIARLPLVLALGAGLLVPGSAAALPSNCQVLLDRAGDVAGPGRNVPGALATAGAGDAVDLLGLAIYTLGYGDLVVELGVRDLAAPPTPGTTTARYTVHWRYGDASFWVEAVRAGAGWDFELRRQRDELTEVASETAFPVTGHTDAATGTIRVTVGETVLGDDADVRVLTDVWARAQELAVPVSLTIPPLAGIEAATPGPVSPAALASDHLPDTIGRTATMVLDGECARPAEMPVGATDLCRVAVDPAGDQRIVVPVEDAGRYTDITGAFVGSTDDAVVFELGLTEVPTPGGSIDPLHAIDYRLTADLAGLTSVVLDATWGSDGWTFAAHLPWPEGAEQIPVAGSLVPDRLRFEVSSAALFEAVHGYPLGNVRASAREWRGAVPVASDELTGDPATGGHILGTPCRDV